MLQLHNLPTSTEGRLCRATARRDGASVAWDLDVAFDLHDENDADSVEPFVPGTVAVWCSGQEGGRGTVKVSGGFDLCHVAFAREREQLATGHAEIRSCSVNVAAEQSTLVVRLRVHGLLPKAAAALVYQLDEVLQVSMDSRQFDLFQPPKKEATESPPEASPEWDGWVGRVIVVSDGADKLAGICSVASHEEIIIETLEAGPVVMPRPEGLDTVLEVVTPDGVDMGDLLEAYQTATLKASVVPSWHYIVTAIGELYAEGSLSARDDFAWELSPGVFTRAIEICGRPIA